MASHVFNKFKQLAADGPIDLDTDTIWAALCMTNTTGDRGNDGIEYVGDLTTLDEFDGANAVRKALANKAVNLDDANDRAEFDADDITWSSLGPGTRDVAGVLIYVDADNDGDSADDAANRVIAWIEFSASPDGNDFEIQWNAEGILQLT